MYTKDIYQFIRGKKSHGYLGPVEPFKKYFRVILQIIYRSETKGIGEKNF